MHDEADTTERAGPPGRIRYDAVDSDVFGLTVGLASTSDARVGPAELAPGAYEAAFRASPVALAFARDPHCAVVLRNAAMNRLLPPSLDWRTWRLPDGSSPPLFEGGVPLALDRQPLRLAAFRGEATGGREIELRWPGREPVFLRVSAAQLRDATGAPCGAVASAVDVTAEQQARRARALASGSADAAGRAKDELLGMMGHELRNPLNAIVTAVEVLNRADPAAPEAQSARRIIGRQARRLAESIGELSEIGRALADRAELVREPVDLGALVGECVRQAAPRAALRGQRLRPEVKEVRVDADPRQLANAIDRLVDEALRLAPEGGTVAVRLRVLPGPGGADAVLEIGEADALGPEAPFEAVAPPPSRFDVPERAGGSLGLALVLVRHVVEQHGGRIDLRRPAGSGGGAVHVLRLPATGGSPTGVAKAATRVA